MAEEQKRGGGVVRWFAENAIAANLLMIVLLVGGLLSTRELRQEVFPEVTRDIVRVQVSYPGASPEEVEQGIVLSVEEAIRAVDGVEEIRARASEGNAIVHADLLRGADVQQALNDIKSEVDRITTLPQGAERPVITIPSNRQHVVHVIIHGQQPVQTLKDLAEDLRRALLSEPQVSLVQISGVPPPEVSIEVPQQQLRRYDLSLQQVADTVRAASIDAPAGGIRSPSGEVLVRTTERKEYGQQFGDVVLRSNPDGSRLRVRDVATVKDGFRETDEAAYFNGDPAVTVQVYRVGDQTPIEVAQVVKTTVERLRGQAPGVSYTIWDDRSEIYESRVNLLLSNAAMGLVLVLLILGLFLQPRLAFWVTLGIPISFFGAILFMPTLGVSLNMISLFAFLLALGIVVDDAIVVGESVFSERSKHHEALQSAITGTRKVALPVVFAVLTTVVAFAPMLFLPDETGKLYANIPMIVIPILLLSLVEALFILPAHLAHVKKERDDTALGWISKWQSAFSRGFESFIERRFRPIVTWIVSYRLIAIAAGVGTLLLCVGVVGGGFIKFNFMPKIEGDQVTSTVEMPFGTSVKDTERIAQRMTQAAREVLREQNIESYRGVYTHVGQVTQGSAMGVRTSTGSHLASVVVALGPSDERALSSREFSRLWREKLGDVAGPRRVNFQFAIGPGSDAGYGVELRHPDRETLQRAAADLAAVLRSYKGVYNVDDGFSEGKPQFDVELTPSGRAFGITEADLARQLRNAFYGAEAQRDQRGRDELRVYVRRPEHERTSMYYLDSFLVRTPNGGEVPLKLAAKVTRARSFTQIERENASRAVDLSADVDIDVTTPNDVARDIEGTTIPRLLDEYPGLTWEVSGQQLRQARSLAALSTGLTVALLVMFALMAMAFRSYVQPLIVMFAIPFGFVGALAGHLLMGYNLSLVSVLGLVALAGVVVNDSLVLVAAANELRREGLSARDAIIEAAVTRFRPVLLTSLTTFAGLAPMILETSVQARFLIPMAISLGFGVLFVTFIALGLVPALFILVEDVREWLGEEKGEAAIAPGE